ncbi:conserved hypothetical protein [Candida dubliniensis CD36]|uniref:Uncharacterized protein n=1 Tax=Candida dubliniensis (strain CD36 / ATCC MYA-646 / CBS 7987 / NCPF 3949 / NRRL Y-17841) TaxID=573826 RepID=B9W6W3_CANDC|nr:conserved hypothetical protein [Candida dubliniensis CD36]CAX44419.1 conserved hypothetical protein [Candida dubliniensis CD36]
MSITSATTSSNAGNILIADLPPPLHSSSSSTSSPNIALSIKLNQDFIHQLKSYIAKTPSSGNKIKLVVKNGQVSIKLNDEIQYPCLKFPENLPIDVYSNNNYDGRIINKLTVVTDSKKIKHYNTSNRVSNDVEKDRDVHSSIITPIGTPKDLNNTTIIPSNNNRKEKQLSPQKQKSIIDVYGGDSRNPYKVLDEGNNYEALDTTTTIFKKFLHLLALGPITLPHIITILNYDEEELYNWLNVYGQLYNPKDQFIQQDKFPYSDYDYDNDNNSKPVKSNNTGMEKCFILKDKSYKELLPWKWQYNDYERSLVLNNVNNALTRIGFSLTHPLRKKIINNDYNNESRHHNNSNNNNTSTNNGEEKTNSHLGGGLLVSKKKFPTRPPVASTPPPPPPQQQQQQHTSISTTTSPSVSSASTNPIEVKKNGNRITKSISKSPTGINTPSSSDVSSKSSKSRKRKLSSSSSSSNSSLSDDNLTSNIGTTNATSYKSNYNSPPSEQEFDDHYYSSSSSSSSSNTTFGLSNQDQQNLPPSLSSKMDYYTNLANKFRIKYKEYSQLYNHLLQNSSTSSNSNNSSYKKNLMKLFELHQLLSQWKKLLWDFDKDLKLKQNLTQLHVQKRNEKTVNVGNTTTTTSTTTTSIKNSNIASGGGGGGGNNKSPLKKRKLIMDY